MINPYASLYKKKMYCVRIYFFHKLAVIYNHYYNEMEKSEKIFFFWGGGFYDLTGKKDDNFSPKKDVMPRFRRSSKGDLAV